MIYTTDNSQIGACLYRRLYANLGGDAVEPVQDLDKGQPGDLFVGVIDSCQLEQLVRWERKALNRQMRFLAVHVQGGEAIIGPEIRQDRSGCLTCWTTRYFGARKNARHFAQNRDLLAQQSP